MRRILSLTLVTAMLLSTLMLTSCDTLTHFFSGLSGNKQEEPTRTTITEMEWRNAYKNTNYTLEFEDNEMKADIIVCNSWVKMLLNSYEVNGITLNNVELVFDFKNNLVLCETSMGWMAQNLEGSSFDSGFMFKNNQYHLGAIKGLPNVDFDDLVYEEQTQSYIAKDDSMLADCYFENGVLVSATLESVDTSKNTNMKITNIGTSIIEIPSSYENLSDAKVIAHTADTHTRTTITAEEFANNKNLMNSTIFIYSSDFTVAVAMVMKQNSKAIEISICVGDKTTTNQRAVIINGYLYNLTETNGKYIATQTSSTPTSALGDLLDNVDFNELTYDEANGYYTYTNYSNNTDGYFYFENGNLVKIVSVSNNMKTIAYVTNINSTEIDIPVYTVK